MFTLLDDRVSRKQLGSLAAIDFRLTALARLVDERGGRGFTYPRGAGGLEMVHPSPVRRAREEPLVEHGNQLASYVDNLQRRLLGLTQPHC